MPGKAHEGTILVLKSKNKQVCTKFNRDNIELSVAQGSEGAALNSGQRLLLKSSIKS